MTHDITLKAKDKDNPTIQVVVRISGDRLAAVKQAMTMYPAYDFQYVLTNDRGKE